MDEHLDFNAEEYTELANEWREKLIEAIADFDEDIMEKYFAGEEIPEAELKAAIRKATINVDFYPMLAGSAFKNKGVQMMLDAVIDYLPSPLDIPAIQGVNPDTDEEDERPASDEEPFAALRFQHPPTRPMYRDVLSFSAGLDSGTGLMLV
ncbi:Elongation factor G [Lactococcus lactis]|nr:hypothetical protein [Lactococcus lactis]MDU0399505.1 Elongation factor G [Lactococcus lactis]